MEEGKEGGGAEEKTRNKRLKVCATKKGKEIEFPDRIKTQTMKKPRMGNSDKKIQAHQPPNYILEKSSQRSDGSDDFSFV